MTQNTDVDPPDRTLPIATARRTWRVLGTELRAAPWSVAVALAAFTVSSACGLVAPWVLGLMVDDVIDRADATTIVRSTAIIGASALGTGVFTMIGVRYLARVGEGVLASLRERVVDRALHAPTEVLERAGRGDLLTRVSDDVSVVTRTISTLAPTLVGALFSVALTAGGLFGLDWRLALAGLTAAPVYVLAVRWYLPRSGPLYAQERVAMARRSQALVSSLQGQWTVRAYQLELAHLGTINHRSQQAMDRSLAAYRMFTLFLAWLNRAELLGLGSLLAVGFVLVRTDQATVGAATAAALLFHRLFNPLGALVVTFDQVQSAGASLARLVGVADLQTAHEPDDPPRPADSGLVFSAITHRYGDGPVVLDDVSFEVAPGERVALVGASGAGKTTLCSIAAGLTPATHGCVRIGGVPHHLLGARGLRRQVALVSQDIHVFSGALIDDVRIGCPDATPEEVAEALRTVGAWQWLRALPDGLDTQVGEHGHLLTPPQAQQLALARLVLVDPPIVLLDEATAEAGSAGAYALEQAAHALTRDRTTLIVAHRLTQAVAADRIVVLDRGRVVETGTHDELATAGGRYAELWAAWRPPDLDDS